MDIHIHVEKRHLVFLVVLACVFLIAGVSASTYKLNGVGHDANETGPGTFGGTSADTYIFPGFVRANELNATTAITINGDRRTSWPPAVFQLPAENISAGIFGVNVGNGDFGFPNNLNVNNLLTSKNITVKNITVEGNMTLGGISRGSWSDGVPSGFCVFTADPTKPCPAGWTRTTSFDNRTIRGSASGIGQIGGNNTHQHFYNGTTSAAGGVNVDGNSWPVAPAYHTHKYNGTTNSSSSWPPYINVTICCKN
jgi:hypothetical protein